MDNWMKVVLGASGVGLLAYLYSRNQGRTVDGLGGGPSARGPSARGGKSLRFSRPRRSMLPDLLARRGNKPLQWASWVVGDGIYDWSVEDNRDQALKQARRDASNHPEAEVMVVAFYATERQMTTGEWVLPEHDLEVQIPIQYSGGERVPQFWPRGQKH